MMRSTRRDFLHAASGATLAWLAACAAEPAGETASKPTFSKPLGAQLYTLRTVLPENPAQVLKDLAAIGYSEVEVLQASYPEMKPLIEDAGLKATSMHLLPPIVTGMWGGDQPAGATIEVAAEQAAAGGIAYLVMPYLRNEERGADLEAYKALAAKLNQTGEACRGAGLGFAYHNHAFEFEPMGDSSPLEVLLAETDPALVQLELDVFWVSVAGQDPAEALRNYSGRVPLVHLKDKAADAPQQYNERVPRESFKEVGAGSLDFGAILKACEEAGVKHYFVEQDQTPGDPLDSLRQSFANLRSMEV